MANSYKQNSQQTLILGTRGSLLATTQARQVADQIEALSGVKVDLKIIKTQGDQIADVPLWQLDGKDFFTKELDHALIAGEVDFVVHSLKDLGGERPKELHLAAITRRVFPNDILLVSKSTAQALADNTLAADKFVVGTSSPRRIVNLTRSLGQFLPSKESLKGSQKERPIETKFLRGNVNSRVKKLIDGDYHGIVLAMTGLERLSRSPKAMQEMAPLFSDLTFMILPQSEFPTAAGQGALGIECRQDNQRLREILAQLHDPKTAREVLEERRLFRQYGGGCHLAVGLFAREIEGELHTIEKGEFENKKIEKENFAKNYPPKMPGSVFIGLNSIEKENTENIPETVYDQFFQKEAVSVERDLNSFGHVLLATAYGAADVAKHLRNYSQLLRWCSGNRTMKKLARQGVWCHGSLEGLGEHQLAQFLEESHFLRNFFVNPAVALFTHEQGNSKYIVVESYRRKPVTPTPQFLERLNQCSTFYWTSYDQYLFYRQFINEADAKTHCCGIGKTYQQFKAAGISALPFPSMTLFKQFAQRE